jgi:hypothetical protein
MRYVQDEHSNAVFYDIDTWRWVESMEVQRPDLEHGEETTVGRMIRTRKPGLKQQMTKLDKFSLAAKFEHRETGAEVWVVSVHLKAIGTSASNIPVHQPEVNNWLLWVLARAGRAKNTMIVAGGDFNDGSHDLLMHAAVAAHRNDDENPPVQIAATERHLQQAFAAPVLTHRAGNSAPPTRGPVRVAFPAQLRPPPSALPPPLSRAIDPRVPRPPTRATVHETEFKHKGGSLFARLFGVFTHTFDGLYSLNTQAVDGAHTGRAHEMHAYSDHYLIDWTVRLHCPGCQPPAADDEDEEDDRDDAAPVLDEDEEEEEEEEDEEEEDEEDEDERNGVVDADWEMQRIEQNLRRAGLL